MRITDQQVAAAHEVASLVFDGVLPIEAGAVQLQTEHGLNLTSARDFINDYRHLLRGQVFHRAMSASAMDYFLSRINLNRGSKALANSVKALRLHIEYYEGHYKVTSHSMRTVASRYEAAIDQTVDAASQAVEFDIAVRKALEDSAQTRLMRLAIAPKRPIRVMAKTEVFLRNADVVAEVLSRAAGLCQSCHQPAPFRRRSDGTPYLEVHHRVQLSCGGEDTVENAVALCPNCHRRQHHGEALYLPEDRI